MEIFVGNLAESITPADLKQLFDGYGNCSGFLLVDRRLNGRTSHCAYGVIEPDDEARRAIRELNHKELRGRPVMIIEHITEERRRPKRTPWGGRERRRRQRPFLVEPLVVSERRRQERRSDDRRHRERRVADRRSPTQVGATHPLGEERFNDHRVAQRRVGERRQGERRRSERRHRT